MDSSNRLFNRQRTVHEILGGGLVADVMLWRRGNLTMGILLVTLAAWVVFEKSGYTLLSLVSNVLLLLIVILFLWAKSAAILNRPAPPLPELYLSQEMVDEVGAFIRAHVNDFLSASRDIALGKDARLFFKAAAYLLLISVVGSLADFLTLGYTSLVVVLTVPALYERYEDYIDSYTVLGSRKMQQLYVKFDSKFVNRFQKWILERQKLS
ncbi:Reticulon-like protein B12 [Hibiscus syriacus]|uniref:Reticulon-like protein n=1 Tax=Hibiscus syriacus TaxID=106335 RepID=A0A6A2Z5J9_HIBSY|nr:reticulon-like protein B12 [Hibiscus syriacus]KAE8686967.1 Reticulon-like protein B12 [Hibiscus syriacus]